MSAKCEARETKGPEEKRRRGEGGRGGGGGGGEADTAETIIIINVSGIICVLSCETAERGTGSATTGSGRSGRDRGRGQIRKPVGRGQGTRRPR